MKKDEIHLGGTARSPHDAISLHEMGLQFAEIPITDPGKFTHLRKPFQTLKRQLGLYYLCHGPEEGDPNDTDALELLYFPKVMKILSIMPELEMSLLTLHLWLDPRFVRVEVIDYKIQLLKRVIGRANDLGIVVCIENLSESASHLVSVFKILPLLNLTLDLGHAQLLSRQNTGLEFMAKYPERIKHIHLHDNRGGDSPEDDLHLSVGEGTIDFQTIFRELRTIGYQRTITLELRPHEIKKCLGYVKQLLSYE